MSARATIALIRTRSRICLLLEDGGSRCILRQTSRLGQLLVGRCRERGAHYLDGKWESEMSFWVEDEDMQRGR